MKNAFSWLDTHISCRAHTERIRSRFDVYSHDGCELTAHVDNLGSWKLLERNGFTKTREEHRYHPDLTVKDRRVYELGVPAAQQESTSKTQETKCCAAS